jgi:peptidyl-prolyl cis-trans isomerase B (cyclophilin B)
MSGSKRERELARAKYERQQARRAARAEKRRRNQRITAVAVVVVLVLAALVFVVVNRSGSSEPVAADSSPSAAASATAAASAASSASSEPIEEPAVLDCTPPGTPRANDVTYDAPGDAGSATSITFATNCGDIVVALDPAAPQTIASEAFLASSGFYDSTSCHRLTTEGIFVLQCGDPAGDGTGGPGYTVPDENLPAAGEANYPAGTVAMANAGPGTSGSQFFIVYDDTTLPGDYTIWGTVTSGLDIVQEIASVGVADGGADGAPQQPVFIETATVQAN